MILAFNDYEPQSRRLAAALDMPLHIVSSHRFPDGELKLTLPEKLPDHVIICQSLDQPNEKLIALLLAAKTARELGAATLTLVAPYLCYMRQDMAFHPGEAVSQGIVGGFLAGLFDNVITVDPHLHRTHQLKHAVPATAAVTLTATSLMAGFLSDRVRNPILLGPDEEAEQWVKSVAAPNQWPYGVCKKTRRGDKDVDVDLPDIDLNRSSVVLVDDVASSGQTLATAAKGCLASGALHVDVLVTHALFFNSADEQLRKLGVRNIWSTDSVSHASSVIHLSGLLATAISTLQ